MAEQEQNRSEAATPSKLRQAKQRGSVAKSLELNSVFVLAAFLGCLFLWIPSAAGRHLHLDARILEQAATLSFDIASMHAWLCALLGATGALLLPVFASLMIAGALSSLVQHGPIFSTHPIKPDFARLNPAAGFKRLFSRRALFDLLKNVAKLGLFLSVLWVTVRDEMPALISLLSTDVRSYDTQLVNLAVTLLSRLLLAMVAVALLDLLFVRWEFTDRMRMSRRELKDEVRQREGDPMIKSRIRQLQAELRKKSHALRNLPAADLLVTNPTHLGIALKYDPDLMSAPQVVAKGAGDLVDRMKQVARRHRVTIVEHRRLARELHALDIDRAVPEASYAEVARILVWVQAARGRSITSRRPAGSEPH